MNRKTIPVVFRQPSNLTDYFCPDGELLLMKPGSSGESSGSPDSSGSPSDPSSPSGIINPILPSIPSGLSILNSLRIPAVEFALAESVAGGWHNHPDNFPSSIVSNSGHSESGWGDSARELLSSFQRSCDADNLFIQPFFVVCAWRLDDGSHILPSSPVLLIPNSGAPTIVANGNTDAETMTMSLIMKVCRLRSIIIWKPQDNRLETIASLRNAGITHLDIFVSPPIPVYKPEEKFTSLHNVAPSIFSHSFFETGKCGEHMVSGNNYSRAWQPEPCEDYEIVRSVASCGEFRHISEIPLTGIDKDTFKDVEFNCGSLRILPELDSYIPDYYHLQKVEASGHSLFSGRVSIFDLTLAVASPPPMQSMLPHVSGMPDSTPTAVATDIAIIKKGETLHSSAFDPGMPAVIFDEANFPRFMFFPDPDATKITVITETGSFVVPLRKHRSLNGSYYFRSLNARSVSETGVSVSDTRITEGMTEYLRRDTYRMPSGVWRSGKGNAMVFPDSLLFCLDVERVIALCRAFRASGLVATTSPTAYLFSTGGVFLLKETDDGMLKDAGLMAAYVVSGQESISIDGRSLYFSSTDGILYEIDGTKIKPADNGKTNSPKSTGLMVISGAGGHIKASTRPIKLGDAEKTKRVTSVELRGNLDASKLKVSLYGCAGLDDWHLIARGKGGVRGLSGPRLRFIRVEIEGNLEIGETIEALCFTVLL